MSNADLHKRIAQLEENNQTLFAENRRLREMLGLPDEKISVKEGSVSTSSINKHSTPEQKIALFMSLFRGRTDVYAKRCYSKKHDSSYYVPACENEWVRGICEKPRIKCKDCKRRELSPLTVNVIDTHLRNENENGIGVVGIYPLLPDETCFFLAVDFDEAKWEKDVDVFRSVCDNLNIPVAIERSRSGNGAHAWLFFEEPIPAISARKLGNALLTKAMSVRSEIQFSSYDRMFPNQDFMPKGGFGNLIALPLQKGVRENGNSEFVDENFRRYPDQWAYLDSIRKMDQEEVDKLLVELCVGNGLGEFGDLPDEKKEITIPWEGEKIATLECDDFPNNLTIIEANRLYVQKEGVSPRAINRIKRLSAFQNPQFYKTQKMRMSTYGIPRIIWSLDETDEYVGIPRGCKPSLIHLLEESETEYIVKDKRDTGRKIDIHFKGILREEQQSATSALLQHENGVLLVPTAFGKTVIGASLIAERKCNTLIIVHLQTLLDQWRKSLKQFLEINESLPEPEQKQGRKKIRSIIGQIGAGKDTSSGIIDIALIQSLIHDDQVKEVVKNYGMVIVDECHHASSLTYEKVLGNVNARYVYGLTATPNRQDGQHPVVFMQCGAIRHRVSAKEQADRRGFAHFIIPCFTSFRKPLTQSESDWHITKIYSTLAEDEDRNQQIVRDVLDAVENNRTPIILTQRKDHVTILSDMLKTRTNANVIVLVGTDSAKKKREHASLLVDISPAEKLIIVATGKYIGEGFDYPRLDTLFLASPIAWKETLAQYAGRLHREYPGKKDVIVYDYVDIHIPVLERMYHKRLTGYAQIGYKALSSKNMPDTISMLYDSDTFLSVLKRDFEEATIEILIVCPYIRKKQVDMVLELLHIPLSKNIPVTVITRPVASYRQQERVRKCVEALQEKVTVKTEADIYQKYIIIDNQLVWYGSIGLLDDVNPDDTIMRLETRELVRELKTTHRECRQ
ncbi:DEAD/DEAH box helicase family protein [Proteiniphilum sp.]|uniref:TOTE conflict system archaeo-eukaryotic primase domain-containing protein n=1 Tax=Proteiniphilum sp. TaxID=1926877 RepID=UPI00331AB285